jgi:hypothetical protein
MKKVFAKGAAVTAAVIGAVATVSALPSTASAQGYYDCNRGSNTAAGAIIGGAAGALLGSGVAARGHRNDGAALGGVLGAVTGAAVGSNSSNCRYYDNRYDDRRGYYDNSYYGDRYDNRGRGYYDNSYYGGGGYYAPPPAVYVAPPPPPVVVVPAPAYRGYYGGRRGYYGYGW